jgi:protein involved in polysaccharide export with SLBB domain
LLFRTRTSRRKILAAVTNGVALSAIAFAGGCETKSFIDPTELGRYKRDPLVLPIVNQLDPVAEGPDAQWTRATDPTADDLKAAVGDYRVSANDLLAITLSDINGPNTETVKQARVTESGNISLPYLESPIRAAGLTEIQLEQVIVQAYKTANLIQHAQISVTTVEARGRAFSVLGAVGASGEYAIVETDFRLLNAMILARNVNSPFVDYVYVIRQLHPAELAEPATMPAINPGPTIPAPSTGPSSDELAPKSEADHPSDPVASAAAAEDHVMHLAVAGDSQAQAVQAADQAPAHFDGFRDPGPEQDVRIIRIPYDAIRRGDLRYNITIRPKDVIYVPDPQTGYYYVGGHVARPGAYTLSGQKMTLKDAIISASMFDGLAIPERTDIIRQVHPDHEIYVRVDLTKIFSGEEPDLYLKPHDKIMVGTNALAPFIAAFRGAFRVTYGLGFLYDRNYSYSSNGQAL